MTAEERILALLCCRLGDTVLPLTLSQYDSLRRKAGVPLQTEETVLALCEGKEQERICKLLERGKAVQERLSLWSSKGVEVCTVLSPDYPENLRKKLGEDTPPLLFLLGNRKLLGKSALSLVGSRNLREENRCFAMERGEEAARRGKVLCSGDARGADRTAQDACLKAGGQVLSFVSDRLLDRKGSKDHLYISEDGPDYAFSSFRALSRNRLIHCMGDRVYVAQVEDGRGGTWSGTHRNLLHGWTEVYYYPDGTEGSAHLQREGAKPFLGEEL